MKILCTGDWHVRATPTRFRTSSYYEQMLNKHEWVANLAKENNALIILQPGDFGDSPDFPDYVARDIIKIYKDIVLYTVYGQHDMKYRQLDKTKLALLIETEALELVNEDPDVWDEDFNKTPVAIYGASWDEPIPEVKNKECFNILVIHKMIVENDPLFPDQENYSEAAEIADNYSDYNLIVSGDNHHSFSYFPESGPAIINCGSLMRMTTAQYDHKPCVWVVDTETGELGQHFIPIEPVEKVFKEEVEEIKERDEKMEAFIKTLSSGKRDTVLSFEDNLKKIMKKSEVDGEIVKLVDSFVSGYYNNGE